MYHWNRGGPVTQKAIPQAMIVFDEESATMTSDHVYLYSGGSWRVGLRCTGSFQHAI